MKIGLGVPGLGFQGGIELHAHDLARSLRARGHRVALLHGAGGGRDADRYALAFDEVRPLTDPRAAAGLDVAYVQKATAPEELAPYAGVPVAIAAHDHDLTCLRRHRYTPLDHVPCHRPPGLACIAHACAVVRDPRADAPLPVDLRSPFALRRRLAALAARGPLVACSAYVAFGLIAAGVDHGRVHVVHPVPPNDAAPLVARPAAPRLVAVGQLVRGKGFDIAIDALARLPHEATLAIAGDGSDRARLEDLAARLAPGRVRFHGYVAPERVRALYDDASAVVVPSRWPEPFGMVGIEAMRRGRPVVAARHGGIPEWLTDGRGGRLFAPGDAGDLARAARTVLDDPEAGHVAAREVGERFDHATTVHAIERILDDLATRSPRADPRPRGGTQVALHEREA